MEEDIKILEEFISVSNKESFADATSIAFAWIRIKDRYRELEEKVKELFKTCCNYEDILEHYEYKIFDELDDYIKLDEISKLDRIGIKGKKYISESKIKEFFTSRLEKYQEADDGAYEQDYLTRGELELVDRYKECKEIAKILLEEEIEAEIPQDYIPKSKIKEKIEPVIDSLEENDFVGYADELRDIMSELMEDK